MGQQGAVDIGFVFPDIEHDASEVFYMHGLFEGVGVHDAAAGGIQEEGAFFEPGEKGGIGQMICFILSLAC